jgi:hypothetical protein
VANELTRRLRRAGFDATAVHRDVRQALGTDMRKSGRKVKQ